MIKFYTFQDKYLPCDTMGQIEEHLMLDQDNGFFIIENDFDASILNWMLDHIDSEDYSTKIAGRFEEPGNYIFDESNCLNKKSDYWPVGWDIFNFD